MYTILASSLVFFNLFENITATVSSFGHENETNHKQILHKLMNKLPDYLTIHWHQTIYPNWTRKLFSHTSERSYSTQSTRFGA
jgi:hypothetical protein